MGLFDGFRKSHNPYRRALEPPRPAGVDLALDAGFASVYFVTDPQRGVAVLEDPTILLAPGVLRLEEVAACFAKAGGGRSTPADVAQGIRDLMAGKGASPAAGLGNPCLVVAGGFEPGLLSTLKILKLRGLAGILALGGEGLPFDRLARVSREPTGFKPVKGLRVVGGLRRTVLSTTRSVPEILGDHPELVADVSAVKEPI